MSEPIRIGLASRRGAAWSAGLRSHLADHTSGYRVSLILDPTELAKRAFAVVFVDDQARALTPSAVAAAIEANTFVIGLTDEANGRGRAHLEALGAQRIVSVDTPATELVAILDEIGPRSVAEASTTTTPRRAKATGVLSLWARASGGAGLTEAVLASADRLGAAARVLVIEATETPGMSAARLGRSPETTLAWATDRVAQGQAALPDALARPLPSLGRGLGDFDLIAQANAPGGPPPLAPDGLVSLIEEALGRYDHVVVETGAVLAPAPGMSRDRAGAARAVAARADVIVLAAGADPLGAIALVTARATLAEVAVGVPVWGIFGRAGRSAFQQARLAEVVEASMPKAPLAGLVFLPEDPAVAQARWNGGLVRRGPWAKAVAGLAAELGALAPRSRTEPARAVPNSLGVVMSA